MSLFLGLMHLDAEREGNEAYDEAVQIVQ
jgi:hypothetical protein